MVLNCAEVHILRTTNQVPLTNLDTDICKAVLSEYRIHNADISLRYDATVDDLIDVIEGNRFALLVPYFTHVWLRLSTVVTLHFSICRVYIPCIYALNKIDQLTLEELDVIDKIPHYVPISAHLEWNLDGLLEKVWDYLNLTRMYDTCHAVVVVQLLFLTRFVQLHETTWSDTRLHSTSHPPR